MDNYAYLVHKLGRDHVFDKLVSEWMKTYDFVFKLPISGEPRDDKFRETDLQWQNEIDLLIADLANELGIKYFELGADKSQWAPQVLAKISVSRGPLSV